MKKTAVLILIALISSFVVGCAPRAKKASANYNKDKYVFLVAGFDEAAENTDVLFTISYDADNSEARVAQIPRDTYFEFGKVQNKINQLYASKISAGVSEKKALEDVANVIASAFGTKFDGFFGVRIETFKKLVNVVGGLDITLSEDKTIDLDGEAPIVLKAGNNHIDGDMAERFVRYRSGYAMGDLGRIDAQKIFLNALFSKLLSGMKLQTIFKAASIIEKEVITNVRLYDFINVFIDVLNSKSDKKAFYATVPGEPTENEKGLSFYVLNRKSAAEMAQKYMFATDEFDEERRFLNGADAKFKEIYEEDNIGIKEYTADSVDRLQIAKK